MELQIGTDEFSRALYRAQGIVEKKSTMPILGSVLLEAQEGNRLSVSAFDLEIGVQTSHPAEVRKVEGGDAQPVSFLRLEQHRPQDRHGALLLDDSLRPV